MHQKDFSRNRKQSFSGTLSFMINFLTKSLSLEIVNFLDFLGRKEIIQKAFTKSAFVQARKKINPEVFTHLNQRLLEEFYTDNSTVRTMFSGLRVLAIDGSRITLPFNRELEKIYGRTTNGTNTYIVQARACVMYDVLNKMGIAGVLSPGDTDERIQAKQLISNCLPGDLLIYDRGYPSFDLFHDHHTKNLDFIMRVKLDFNQVVKTFVQGEKKSQVVEMSPGKNTSFNGKEYSRSSSIKVRLVRIPLPSGEIEILVTSLLDSRKFNTEMFKNLYFERWKIETYYDELKNKLRIEEFSGYSNQSIQQDFHSSLFVSNVQSLIVEEINSEVQQSSNTKHQYKVNTSMSYGLMKDRIMEIFLGNKDMDEVIGNLKEILSEHLIPIRPGRSNPRKMGIYRSRVRPTITKNRKNSL